MTPDEIKKKLESLNSLPQSERVNLLNDLKDIVKEANSELQVVYQKAQADLKRDTDGK